MKTLLQLLESGYYTSDISVIKAYLSQDGVVEDVPELLTELMKDKLHEYERLRRRQLEYGRCENFRAYFHSYNPEAARML